MANMVIGYARVSVDDQNLDLQRDALKKAGCAKIYEEEKSGPNLQYVELEKILGNLSKGDTLIVWRLDRLGRSLKNLVDLVNTFGEKQINFKSLNESIDTSSITGKLIFNLFAALAEFERNLIRERTNVGLGAARARGKHGGRPKSLNQDQVCAIKSLYREKKLMVQDICNMFKITKPTLYKYLRSV